MRFKQLDVNDGFRFEKSDPTGPYAGWFIKLSPRKFMRADDHAIQHRIGSTGIPVVRLVLGSERTEAWGTDGTTAAPVKAAVVVTRCEARRLSYRGFEDIGADCRCRNNARPGSRFCRHHQEVTK